MPTDWNDIDSWKRLAAATWAASPQNHNYRDIASYFGQGATYDSIEGRFRIIKKEASKLKSEVDSGERPEAPVRGGGGGGSGGGITTPASTPKKKKPANAPGSGSANRGSATTTPSSHRGTGTAATAPTAGGQTVLNGRITKTGTHVSANGSPSKKAGAGAPGSARKKLQPQSQSSSQSNSQHSQNPFLKTESHGNSFGASPAANNRTARKPQHEILYADDVGNFGMQAGVVDDDGFVLSQGLPSSQGYANVHQYGWTGELDDDVV